MVESNRELKMTRVTVILSLRHLRQELILTPLPHPRLRHDARHENSGAGEAHRHVKVRQVVRVVLRLAHELLVPVERADDDRAEPRQEEEHDAPRAAAVRPDDTSNASPLAAASAYDGVELGEQVVGGIVVIIGIHDDNFARPKLPCVFVRDCVSRARRAPAVSVGNRRWRL